MIGGWEIIVILFVILLLFGGKKLPEFARNLGKGLHEFKKASQGNLNEESNDKEEPPQS
jgi:sec-independent protein translocase protein TatA